jgi:hypothetical protein
MSWWRWHRDSLRGLTGRTGDLVGSSRSAPGSGIVAECEAFLTGHLVEHTRGATGFVSPWTWTNLLAHGTEDELRAAIAKPSRDRWEAARALLADDLLDLAGSPEDLREIQRTVLVPLELELASRSVTRSWEPQRWAGAVSAVLREVRRSRGAPDSGPRHHGTR